MAPDVTGATARAFAKLAPVKAGPFATRASLSGAGPEPAYCVPAIGSLPLLPLPTRGPLLSRAGG